MTDEVKTDGRSNQQERGLSVDLDTILPKLNKEQRKLMSADEKKAYNAQRLKEYRNAYSSLYNANVVNSHMIDKRKEQLEAFAFYRKYKDIVKV